MTIRLQRQTNDRRYFRTRQPAGAARRYERLEYVDAPSNVDDLKRCRARGYAMAGNRCAIVTDHEADLIGVHLPWRGSVELGGLTVERCPPAPSFLPPDIVTLAWESDGRIIAENGRGGSLLLGEGAGEISACDALMAALGGCASQALIARLRRSGVAPERLQAEVSGTRCAGVPSMYETFHVVFSIAIDLDDAKVEDVIREAMTEFCPVAVTLGRAAEVTWEYRRVEHR